MLYISFTLGVVHSMGLEKYVMMCIYHYSIKQNNSFIALNIPCAPSIHPSFLSLQPLDSHQSFSLAVPSGL